LGKPLADWISGIIRCLNVYYKFEGAKGSNLYKRAEVEGYLEKKLKQ
jgi:hypothetical protein